MTVAAAVMHHYAAHGLPADGGEHDTWFRVHIGPFVIPLPNPPSRRNAVFLHDVNHVLTGYNTVSSDGEMSIAGVECGAGCGRVWIAWFINLSLMIVGLVIRSRAVLRAFRRGRRTISLYAYPVERTVLREMTVRELRHRLRIESGDTR